MASQRAIYFCGSIRGGRGDADLYARLIKKLSKYGKVLTTFVGDPKLTHLGSEHEGGDSAIHDRDVEWLTEADVVVAEVTHPSLGVGYEIGRAVAMNKKILCLYRPQPDKKLSAMIRGIPEGQAVTFDYKESDVDEIFSKFF